MEVFHSELAASGVDKWWLDGMAGLKPESVAWRRGNSVNPYWWRRVGATKLVVISDVALVANSESYQWHVSVSGHGRTGPGRRVTDGQLNIVRRDFFRGLAAIAEEDNHEPGFARHLWLPFRPELRVDCECKADEVTVVTDGHVWTNTVEGMDDPAHCRGCGLEALTGRRCPLHNSAT